MPAGRSLAPFLALVLLGCGSHASVAPAASPQSEAQPSAPSCEGRHEVSLTFAFYGEEGESETIALVCNADQPRAVVDASSAALEWSRWEQAWTEIEGLDSPCRPQANCPPEPDTGVVFTDADGKTRLACSCARDELVEALIGAALDAGLHVEHAR